MDNNKELKLDYIKLKDIEEARLYINKIGTLLYKLENSTNRIKIGIDYEDFKIIKVLISERYHELKNKIDDNKAEEVNIQMFNEIKEIYLKYCDNK